MGRSRAALALLVLGVAAPPATVHARDVRGVAIAESQTVAGRTLALNGAGTRRISMLETYVAALWLERPGTDGGAILASDGARRLELHWLVGSNRNTYYPYWETAALGSTTGDPVPALKRFKKLVAKLPDPSPGDVWTFTWAPEKGVTVAVNGKSLATSPQKDTADALFSVWIGSHPLDATLKDWLLAGPDLKR
jgi:hypothetical protein